MRSTDTTVRGALLQAEGQPGSFEIGLTKTGPAPVQPFDSPWGRGWRQHGPAPRFLSHGACCYSPPSKRCRIPRYAGVRPEWRQASPSRCAISTALAPVSHRGFGALHLSSRRRCLRSAVPGLLSSSRRRRTPAHSSCGARRASFAPRATRCELRVCASSPDHRFSR